MKLMLRKLKAEKARRPLFLVPSRTLDNERRIRSRVRSAPLEARKALNAVLSYLFLTDGPHNLRNPVFRTAEPHLRMYEAILARSLKSRTNGNGRKHYGKSALIAIRKAKYRCEGCNEGDVRLLVLDHVNGRSDTASFFVLCANCHQLKSRLFDWTGSSRTETGSK